VEIDLPCSSDADCCSENCLPSGICGGLCYCHDYFDADEQAAKGPMCGGSTGGLCSSGTLPGCLSSADCDQSSSYTECVVPTDGCNASGGMCAYPLFPCEESPLGPPPATIESQLRNRSARAGHCSGPWRNAALVETQSPGTR
jgi:hypothetical protein